MLGLGLGINKETKPKALPYRDDALHYSRSPLIGTDRTGTTDRTSIMPNKIVGDGSTYIDFQEKLFPATDNFEVSFKIKIPTAQPTSGSYVISQYLNGDIGRFVLYRASYSNNLILQLGSFSGSYVATSILDTWVTMTIKRTTTLFELLINDLVVASFSTTQAIIQTVNTALLGTVSEGKGVFEIGYVNFDNNIIFTGEEITSITTQTSLVSADGNHIAQMYLTDSTTIQPSVLALSLADQYGYTVADGLTMYKDEAKTDLYDAGQPIAARQLEDGTFSKTESKAWV